MSTHVKVTAADREAAISAPVFDSAAVALVFLGYFFALRVTGEEGLAHTLVSSLLNMVPLLLLAGSARMIIQRYLIGRPSLRQLAAHAALAPAFTLLWYWLLMVLIGFRNGDSATSFTVKAFFPNPAVAWQLLQGLTFYALVAAVTYLRARPSAPEVVVGRDAAEAPREAVPARYFTRRGEDIVPIDFAQIVSISGADDYAEVSTLSGKHLVRMTLSDFEQALDGGSFIRVHRSTIVNVDRIARAEPAGGGRMLLHMETGDIIQASRTGTRLLRDRVI